MSDDTEQEKVLAVIPARGGSKSIPKKNIADLGGFPLIAYTIESAKNSKRLTDFIVSTDCEEIAGAARRFGARVPFLRPENLSHDFADSWSVMRHALAYMDEHELHSYDAVVMLQPTTPFRAKGLIDNSIDLLFKNKCDSVVSVIDVGASHPHRMYHVNEHMMLTQYVESVSDPMMARQKLPKVFIRSGDIYVTRRHCLVELESLIGNASRAVEVDSQLAVNIDEPIDLEIARLKLASYRDSIAN